MKLIQKIKETAKKVARKALVTKAYVKTSVKTAVKTTPLINKFLTDRWMWGSLAVYAAYMLLIGYTLPVAAILMIRALITTFAIHTVLYNLHTPVYYTPA